jgi:DNA-directed RNA polymerase specialized sigma24 family protein
MSVPDGPSRTQDEWIALRCQDGDNTGFEDLVALMEWPLLYYAAKLTGNAQTAYDVLQDVTELRIAVMQQVSAVSQESPFLQGCISCLLLHPLMVWIRRHPSQSYPPTLQVNEKQDIVRDQPLRTAGCRR